MNLMRKLRGASGSVSDTSEGGSSSSHLQLGLMHLKKLFAEYTHPPQPLTDAEKDDKLYNMLPLFCKVFGTSPSSEMNEKFWDILSFCQQVSKLMVTEIRKRASNQSTEEASCAIAKFLEIENSEESSNGWMLLSTLNLLASGDQSLIQVMTTAAIPSTLVKCLYLFFDLPEIPEAEADLQDGVSEFTPRERRILLQKIFTQVLVRLCSHPFPCEELARKDDLSLLFSAITSWCSPHNIMWRKSAAEVLTTLSRHGLTQTVVAYINNKGCVGLCIENMQKIPELSPLEVVEMFVAVFCFLKDSSDVSQLLLEDFRACHGYQFLSEFLLKHEKQDVPDYMTGVEEECAMGAEGVAALRNLVLTVASLCACGLAELRPARASSELFQLQGFVLPQPAGAGQAVRNVQAFQVLQSVFMKSTSPALCCTILDAISSVYHADNANYFILETQNTLSQFSERIHTKNAEIQNKFFELLEFIVFQLNFVPCKELISLSLLLKANRSRSCSILCMKTLLNILKHNAIFKDVYREVGMLEVFVTCLSRYAVFHKDKQIEEERKTSDETAPSVNESPKAPDRKKRLSSRQDSLIRDPAIDREEEELGGLVMDGLTALLNGNTSNCNVFRECGGAKCVHGMVVHESCRSKALGVIRTLIVSGSGEEDMSALLCGMHAAPPGAGGRALRAGGLRALLACLHTSHRTRTVFRKVSGFGYVTSVLSSLQGALAGPAPADRDVIQLIYLVFYTLNTAMRFEPANAKFFQQEICETTLIDTVRALGCFTSLEELGEDETCGEEKWLQAFHSVFTASAMEVTFPEDIPAVYVHACVVARLLHDVALDAFDKPAFCGAPLDVTSPSLSRQTSAVADPKSVTKPAALNLTSTSRSEPWVIHAGVLVLIIRLLPGLPGLSGQIDPGEMQYARGLRDYIANRIHSLIRSERNQQTSSGGCLALWLVTACRAALAARRHALHRTLTRVIEHCAARALSAKATREFLRLGNPLNCVAPEPGQVCRPGGPVPLTRIKTLVSMTTPRDYRSQSSCSLPPFVEFDMSAEGFGCLYLPSIAPQSANLNALGAQDANTLGGIGSGDRVFPPQAGLTFSTWFCVERYSDPRADPHCVRLLSVTRAAAARDERLACLALLLAARDKCVIVSTQEARGPASGEAGEGGARVWCPELQHEGSWHHLVLVLTRALLKNSTFSLYLDGQHMHSGRLQYLNSSSTATQYCCTLGTAPCERRYSRLVWRQASALLLEDVISAQTVQQIYQLGPEYVGTLQAPLLPGHTDPLPPLVPEEKIIFGINARSMSQLTLAKIRKVYSKNDNKAIAKQLGMSSHENATPIRILHNSAGHLMGPARCLGGVVVGYLGVRVFCPKPASVMINTVGGCSVLLGLIAMAQDVECLYAGVKALVCVVKSNKSIQAEMDRRKGYQTLAMLLKRKKQLLNSHILHLIFGLVGTVDSQKETSSIPNLQAFQDLICELDVWIGAPGGLLKSLLEHLLELALETCHRAHNLRTMRELQLVGKLLGAVGGLSGGAGGERRVLVRLLAALLAAQPAPRDLLCLGQFMVYTLPLPSQNEKLITLSESDSVTDSEQIILRNQCFQLIYNMLFTARNLLNLVICEEISRVLGVDWLLSFMLENVHDTTFLWALRILVIMCAGQGQQSAILQRFRTGVGSGGWLRVASCRGAAVLPRGTPQRALHRTLLQTAAMPMFIQLIMSHLHIPELYYLLFALTLGAPLRTLNADRTVTVDRVWSSVCGMGGPGAPGAAGVSASVSLCGEGVVALLSAARMLLHSEGMPEWLEEHPQGIVQVLVSLYNTLPDFVTIMMTPEVITALASTLFPPNSTDDLQAIGESDSDTSPPHSPQHATPPTTAVHPPSAPLSPHPCRPHVFNLLTTLVLDSLQITCTGKTPPVIDLVLDASPENSTQQQQIEYQTEVLTTLMEGLMKTELFDSETNISNVCYLAARLVDKLWQGQLSRDPHEVFDFLVKLLTLAKKKSSIVSLEGLHHCLNRCILFLLSRPTDTIADQMSVLEALHKLTTNRLLIFGAGNHEPEFIGCLTYCLLQLEHNLRVSLEPSATTWHVSVYSDLEPRDDKLHSHQGRNLMAGAARRVWDELYACKKPAIEEVFKCSLPDAQLCPALLPTAARLWATYVHTERKAVYRVPWEFHNQIQSKIQKVTGGLTRLASRTKVKKEENVKMRAPLSKAHAVACMQDHVNTVRQAWSEQLQTASETSQHTTRYVQSEWAVAWRELIRERGLWGPATPCPLDKWYLDSTEGPSRMRKLLRKNHQFYVHYPYRPELENPDNKQLKYKVAQSLDSKEYYRVYQQWRGSVAEGEGEEGETCKTQDAGRDSKRELSMSMSNEEASPSELVGGGVVRRGPDQSSAEANDEANELEDEEEQQAPPPDNQTLLRLLEQHEKITHMFRCARIEGLDTTEGLLLFGREHCYVIDGFTLLRSREIRDLDSCPADYEPILPSQGLQPSRQRHCSKFLYEDIREVHKRRYLLQPIALEVFSSDGRNYLLAFPRKVRNKAYARLSTLCTAKTDTAAGSVAGQRRGCSVEPPPAASLLASLRGNASVTQRWLRGEISNFQYLMHLNTLAGRSYNDLMQYPVFPWILRDYDSHTLDLTRASTFRDLSKPMGAQTEHRRAQFAHRYKEWDDPHGETPPYHYGTHYSSAMIVCSYLLRMEPFTQHFLRLQGGHFDLADRMFHSVKEAWNSASRHNMADVKELIPEFFYLPEFLVNSNNFDLGHKQSGVSLGDVVLPPWAKGDPREFIRAHREALECDYVSQNLHHWIDLVFGYKQQGKAAVEATNVFHHLFYEGNVDIYNIDDPLKKNATIGFINNFGQIPKQLFKKAHPSKKMSRSSTILDPNSIMPGAGLTPPEKLFYHNLDNLRPSLQPVKEVKGAVGQILYTDKAILAVEQHKVLMPPNYTKYVAWGFADHSIRIGNYDSEKALFVSEAVSSPCGEVVACVCLSDKSIVTAHSSTVVTVWHYSPRRRALGVKASLHAHEEAVTCLAASASYNLLASGSRDGQVVVWDIERGEFIRQLIPPAQPKEVPPPVCALAIDDTTGDIATCRGNSVYWWSINGALLGWAACGAAVSVLCCAFSSLREWDPLYVLITGASDGVVRMWSIDYVPEAEEEKEVPSTDPATLIEVDSKDPKFSVSQDSSDKYDSQASQDDSKTTQDDSKIALDDSKISQDDSKLAQGDSKISQDDSKIALDDSKISQDDSKIALDDSKIALDDSKISQDDSKIAQDDSKVTKDVLKEEDSKGEKEAEPSERAAAAIRRVEELVKQMSLSQDEGNLPKSGSESSLSDACEPASAKEHARAREEKDICSDKEDNYPDQVDSCDEAIKDYDNEREGRSEEREEGKSEEKEEGRSEEREGVEEGRSEEEIEEGRSDDEELKSKLEKQGNVVMRRKSKGNPLFRKSGGSIGDSSDSGSAERAEAQELRPSKSDTSLTDSFVVVPPVAKGIIVNEDVEPRHKWKRRLVLRGKLTMHTAFERRDNAAPAPVTAVAAARGARGVAVGDARGRIFRWSCGDAARAGPADHWIRDDTAPLCAQCQVRFTALERRHHCRECGAVFCGRCSRYQAPVTRLRALRPVRVCRGCHDNIRARDN